MQLLNPRSPAQAVAWARTLITGKPTGLTGKCDHFVGLAYGWGHSGDATALVTWNHALEQHKGDTKPPAGALVVWQYKGPSNPGHIALVSDKGTVISTDVPGTDQVGEVPLGWFAKNWPGMTYLGWIPPLFKAPGAPISKPVFPGRV